MDRNINKDTILRCRRYWNHLCDNKKCCAWWGISYAHLNGRTYFNFKDMLEKSISCPSRNEGYMSVTMYAERR